MECGHYVATYYIYTHIIAIRSQFQLGDVWQVGEVNVVLGDPLARRAKTLYPYVRSDKYTMRRHDKVLVNNPQGLQPQDRH